jgi:polar amino acid transport system substrate-binding protein
VPLLRAVALLAALWLALAGVCRADDAKRVIMFIPDTDWPPYVMSDPAHPHGGVLQAVFRAVAEPMGYEVDVRRLPNQRGWMLLDSGEVHVHAKAREWVKNPDAYLWTDPFMPSETVFLYHEDSDIVTAQAADLYGRSVAAIKGFIYPELEAHFGPGRIERVDVASPFTMLELLALGRVDAALVNGAETRWLMRTDWRLKGFRLDPRPCGHADYRFVFTRDDAWKPFIAEFNARLARMKKDGSLDAILDSYR